MKASSKDLVLLAAVGVAVFWFMSRQQTAQAAAPALSPAADANRVQLGRAILGVPDVLGILRGLNLPTFGPAYPTAGAEDWISIATGTDQIDELPLVRLDRAGSFNPSNPFGPAVDVNPTDPYGTSDMFKLFLTDPS